MSEREMLRNILDGINKIQGNEVIKDRNTILSVYGCLILIALIGAIVSKFLNRKNISQYKKRKIANNFLKFTKNTSKIGLIPLGTLLLTAPNLINLCSPVFIVWIANFIIYIGLEYFIDTKAERKDSGIDNFSYMIISFNQNVWLNLYSENCFF